MIFLEKSLQNQDEIIYAESIEELANKKDIDTIYFESANDTYIVRDQLYLQVHTALNNTNVDRRFKQLVGNFIDYNGKKLRTPGPQYMIPFGDRNKKEFYEVLGFDQLDVKKVIKTLMNEPDLKGFSDSKYLRDNDILWCFFCAIRHYTMVKDSKGLNTTLAIYALAVYPSVFHKYFKYEVSDPGCMAYTIDHLSEKYIFKQQGHVFGTLTYSIQNSYKFLQSAIVEGNDKDVIRFIQRIRNDQNSLIKKVCAQYMANKAKGLTLGNAFDTGEGGEIIDSYANDTSQVEMVVRSIVLPLITNGVNLSYAEASAKMSQISVAEVRFYLTKIIVNEQTEVIEKFIEAILFLWLYDEKKTRNEINSSAFLIWSAQLFRKTNSNNENINTIKNTLNTWGDMTGLHQKFTREASRINYKKAIYYYFILSIQYYNK